MIYTDQMIQRLKEDMARLIQSDATPKKYSRPLLEALEVINQKCSAVRALIEMHKAWNTWHRVDEKEPQRFREVLTCSADGTMSTGVLNNAGEWVDVLATPAWWMTLPGKPEEVAT